MMYKLNTIIKEVIGVKTCFNLEIIGYFNRDLFVDSKKIGSNVDTTTGSLKLFKHYLFFDINDSNLVYDLENNQLFDFKGFRCYPNSLEGNQIICVYNTNFSNNKFSWKTGLLSFKEQKIIREFDFLKDKSIAYYLNKNFVIVYKGTNLLSGISLSLVTGEYEWEVDLGGRKYKDDWGEEKEAKIQQIIGVWEQQLIVTMNHGELLSINIQTGKLNWETEGFGKKIHVNSSYKWSGYLSFDGYHLENGKLYELVGSIYYSFDLNTQAVEILWQDEREDDYITVMKPTYTAAYIYFTGSYNNRFQPHLVGVFNRETLTLDWIEDMNLPIDLQMGYPPSLNQAPQLSDNKIYVLDSGGTLHIFEKENDAV